MCGERGREVEREGEGVRLNYLWIIEGGGGKGHCIFILF